MTSHYSKYGGDYNSMGSGQLERSHGSSTSMVGSPSGRMMSGVIGGERGERSKGGPRETPFMDREYQERLGGVRDRERKDRDARGARDVGDAPDARDVRDVRDLPHQERQGGSRDRSRDRDARDGRDGLYSRNEKGFEQEKPIDAPRLPEKKQEPAPVAEPHAERREKLRKMGTVEILKGIKDLDDRKGEAKKDIQSAENELDILEAALPKLRKAVDKLSKKEPNYPMFTKDISEEELSSDGEEESSDSDNDDGAKKKRTGEKTKNLQRRIESIAPEQRRLLNRLGACMREQALQHCIDNVAAHNAQLASLTSPTGGKFARLAFDDSLTKEEVNGRLLDAFDQKTDALTMSCVRNVLERDLRRTLSAHVLSAIKYRFAFEEQQERRKCEQQESRGNGLDADEGGSLGGNVSKFLASPTRGNSSRGVVRSDLEERIAIATLQAVESVKSMTTLPTQIVATERASRWTKDYLDWNRLIRDPQAAFEMDDVVRPWSQREKDVFAEKFLLFHKDFARIGKYLPNRTIPEIVKFFYSVQRSEEFEITRRKWQLRKRREKSGGNDAGPGGARSGNSGRTNSRDRYTPVEEEHVDEDLVQFLRIIRSAASSSRKSSRRPVSDGSGGWSGALLSGLLLPSPNDDASFVGEVADGNGGKKARRKQSARAKPTTKGAKGTKATKGAKPTKGAKDTTEITATKTSKAATKTPRAPKKSKNGVQQPTAVGRGRLPSVDTDKKYLEAVQMHGKDFVGIGSYINKTPEAAKKYWERHRDRLGLEKEVGVGADVDMDGDGNHDVQASANPKVDIEEDVDIDSGTNPTIGLEVDANANPDAPLGTNQEMEVDVGDVSNVSNVGANGKKRERDRPVWSDADKKALYDAYAVHGRDWQKLHDAVGPSKTLTQVKNFYQNYRQKFLTPLGAPETAKKPKKS